MFTHAPILTRMMSYLDLKHSKILREKHSNNKLLYVIHHISSSSPRPGSVTFIHDLFLQSSFIYLLYICAYNENRKMGWGTIKHWLYHYLLQKYHHLLHFLHPLWPDEPNKSPTISYFKVWLARLIYSCIQTFIFVTIITIYR